MKTITIMNVKGGVGKTASAVNIAYILAKKFGKKVLLIDADAQGNTSDFYNIKENTLDLLSNAFNGYSSYESNTLEDILLDGKNELDIRECIYPTQNENLFLIPAEITLTTAEKKLNADTTTPIQFRIQNHLKEVEDDFDYCIFDCAPYINSTTTNALVCTQKVYTPLKPDVSSLKGLAVTLSLIEEIQTYIPTLEYGGAFFTSCEPNKTVVKYAKEVLDINIGNKLIPHDIRKNKMVEEGSYTQVPLLDAGKPAEDVLNDYIALTEYIMKQFEE